MNSRRAPNRSLRPALQARIPSLRPRGLDGPRREADDPRRPGDRLVPLVILLCAVVVFAGLVAWRMEIWQPATAQAEQRGQRRPTPAAVEAALDAAGKYLRQGEHGKAEAILRQAVAEYPEDQELRVAFGEALMAQRRFAEAYEQYEKALAIGPREAPLEFTAGTLAYEAGLPERALEHYAMAQTADPTDPRYPLYLGQVQVRLGQTESARASLLRAANLDDSSAVAWGTLAELALRDNNTGVALQHIARARQYQPNELRWRLVEARALKRQGEPEAALKSLLALEPPRRRDPAVARLLAECYGMIGRADDAAAALADASDAAPTDAGLALEAAAAAERAGNTARAIALAERAQMLGDEAAARMLERLR